MVKIDKHILEAINNGIKLALDNFNDYEEDNVTSKQNVIKNDNAALLSIIKNDPYIVNLGLPSGTLWARDNFGISPKHVFVHSNDFYGNYYAWGEIRKKNKYTWKNYKWAVAKYNWITKYCTDKDFSDPLVHIDGLTKLLYEDDVVYNSKLQIKDYKFKIPSYEQFKELLQYTTQTYAIGTMGFNDPLDNLNGLWLKSKINGNEIFFPCAGHNGQHAQKEKIGAYWTSDLSNRSTLYSYAFIFDTMKEQLELNEVERYRGLSIRPVLDI